MSAPYDEMADDFARYGREGPYHEYYDRPAMLDVIGDVVGLDVLDAGCGPGLYAEELVGRGARVVGVDQSESMLALAEQRTGGTAELLRADIGQPLPFAAGQFDVVVCALVIHHLSSRVDCLREFLRVLRPGGVVVLSTQHPTSDWLDKGGSYFDVCEEEDVWDLGRRTYSVKYWREPLTSLCLAIADAGFLIERLVEPIPAAQMRDRWPQVWADLNQRPGFLILRLLKPGASSPRG